MGTLLPLTLGEKTAGKITLQSWMSQERKI
jgi:hypothetical protein